LVKKNGFLKEIAGESELPMVSPEGPQVQGKSQPYEAEVGRALLVVNAKSRQGQASFNNVMAELQSQGIEVIAAKAIKNPAEIAPWLANTLQQDQIDTVIIGSGDGSLSALAGLLIEHKVRLGVIPLGTANDFARTLGIQKDLQKAVETLKAGYIQPVDLGLAGDRAFLNAATIGLGVAVAGKMNPNLKKWLGPLAYGFAAFQAFLQRRPIHFSLTYKDPTKNGRETVVKYKALQVGIANGRYFGGGLVSAPNASLDDSRLAVTVIEEMGFLELARLLPGFQDGSYVKHPKVHHFNTTEVMVETRHSHKVNLDGEVCARTPLRFKLLPAALEVFTARP
jgi:diacylglycerol kinase (ATP)